jgi:hypothetical protein
VEWKSSYAMAVIFSIHCFFAKQKSKRMVRNGGKGEDGRVARLEYIRCHASQRKSCVKLRMQYDTTITSHVSKSKMLLLRKVILHRFTFKV